MNPLKQSILTPFFEKSTIEPLEPPDFRKNAALEILDKAGENL